MTPFNEAAFLCWEYLFDEPLEENDDPERATLPPNAARGGRSYTSPNRTADEAAAWQQNLPPINTRPDEMGFIFN